jgi:hypothetical protein
MLWSLQVQLQREGVHAGPLSWLVHLLDGGSYVIRDDGGEWTLESGEVEEPDVVITATKDAFARFLATVPSLRYHKAPDIQITGNKRAIRTFWKAIEVFPFGPQPPRERVRRPRSGSRAVSMP